jgi:hypothetical protein
MSSIVKIILGLMAAIIVIGAVVTIAVVAVLRTAVPTIVDNHTTGVDEAAQIAAEVAEFRLPDGFQAQYGARALGISLASYSNGSERTHLFIAQAGPESRLTREDLQKALGEVRTDAHGKRSRMQITSRTDLTVRGQPATRLVSEGTNSDGQPYRELTLLFQGQAGPALATISAPIAEWDAATFTQFIESIR